MLPMVLAGRRMPLLWVVCGASEARDKRGGIARISVLLI